MIDNKTIEKEASRVIVTGILTEAAYKATKFSKGAESWRISIKLADGQLAKLREACKDTYVNSGEAFTPKWMTEDSEYLNLHSNYDIAVQIRSGESPENSSLADVIADHGSINGSKVAIVINIKEGAIYPYAMVIFELKVVDFEELFGDLTDEDLPF